MPGKQTFIMPTGYEADERRIETRRSLAKLMQEKGLMDNPNMRSWLQVLGQIGTSFAGDRLNRKADRLSSELDQRKKSDWAGTLSEFKEDEGLLNAEGMTRKYRGDSRLEDVLKPYSDAFAARTKEQGNMVNDRGTWVDQGKIVAGQRSPNNPSDMVVRDQFGNIKVNEVAATAAAMSRGLTPNGGQFMGTMFMPDPTKAPRPVSDNGGMDLSQMTPQEKGLLQRELARRAAGGGGSQPPAPNVPVGSPLTQQRPPDGHTRDGRPVWEINGVLYDNPEGK